MQTVTSNFLSLAKGEWTVERLVPFFEFGRHSSLVFVQLLASTIKLKIVGTASFLSTSRRGLKEAPTNSLP